MSRKFKTDIDNICQILEKEFEKNEMPVVELIQIQTNNPFKVLLTTILSARTKDQTTALAAVRLFKKVKNVADLKKIKKEQLEKLIYPVGFYRNKTAYLKKLPEILKQQFNNVIPDSVEELIKLPGVGRKTANLVVAIAFNKPAICVDVHVHRISNRLGYVKTKTPFETEMELRKKLPQKHWINYNSYLVSFGQHLCFPLNPRCDLCPIYKYCPRIDVKTKWSLPTTNVTQVRHQKAKDSIFVGES